MHSILTCCGAADKTRDYDAVAFRPNLVPTFLFIFQLKKMLWSYLKFSTSYGRSTDLKSLFGLLLVSFIWLWEKISLKYLLIARLDLRSCLDWLRVKYSSVSLLTITKSFMGTGTVLDRNTSTLSQTKNITITTNTTTKIICPRTELLLAQP